MNKAHCVKPDNKEERRKNMDRSNLDLLSNNHAVTSPLSTATGTGVGKQDDVSSNSYSQSAATCRGRGVASNNNWNDPTSRQLCNENGGTASNLSGHPSTDSGIPVASSAISNSKHVDSLDGETFRDNDLVPNMGAHQSYSLQRERRHVSKQKSVSYLCSDYSTPKHLPVKNCKSLSDIGVKLPLGRTSPVVEPDDCVDSGYSYAYANKFTQGVRLGDYVHPLDAGKFEWANTVQLSPAADQYYTEPLTNPHNRPANCEEEEYTEPFNFLPDLKKSPVKVVSHLSWGPQSGCIYSVAEDIGQSEYNHLNYHLKTGHQSGASSNSDDEDNYDHASNWLRGHKPGDEVFVENVKNQAPKLKKEELQNRSNKTSDRPRNSNSEIQNVTNCNNRSASRSVSSSKDTGDSEEVYDCAWEGKTGVRDMSAGKGRVSRSVDCYEDAWDTVQKQRELQEKVKNAARKTSAGMSPSPTGLGPPPSSGSGRAKSVSPTLPVLDPSTYEEPWDSKKKQKDLELRLSSQAQRKVSDHENKAVRIPAFRQQNGQPFPTMNTSSKQPRSLGSASSPPSQYEDAWDIHSKGNLLAYLKKNSQSDDVCGSPTHRNVSKPCTVGENINPIIPLKAQIWYHGRVSRLGAETLLRVCKDGSYLVRESESERGQYSLSIKSSMMFIHLRIACLSNGQFILGENSPHFLTIPEMIDYYTRHPVPLKGAVHMTLLHPIAKH